MAEPLRIASPVHKAKRQLEEYMLDASRAAGVEPHEGHLLSYTTLYGPCSASELVRVFGYEASTLTGILDRLERAGLAVREPNAEDRRSILVRVTSEGARIATDLRGRLEALEADIEEQVSARDMKGFAAVMEALGAITQVEPREDREAS